MSKFLTVKMRSAIILATILGVAVTASQSVDFSDDELKAANHLPDSIREKFWSAYSYLLNGAVKVINGVPISTESAINDSYYTIESLYDGRVNLEDYAINGVKEVALNTKSFLVGKQSAVKSILEATIPDVGSVGKYCESNLITTPPIVGLLKAAQVNIFHIISEICACYLLPII